MPAFRKLNLRQLNTTERQEGMKPMIYTINGMTADAAPECAGLVKRLMKERGVSRAYAIKALAETIGFSEWQVKQAISETKGEKV